MRGMSIFSAKIKQKTMAGIVAILVFISIFHFLFYNNISSMMTGQINMMKESNDEFLWGDINDIIDLTTTEARIRARNCAENIIKDIHEEYSDVNVLKQEFDTGNYHSDKFIGIISKNISGRYMYDIHNTRNSMFVVSRYNIIYDENVDGFKSVYRDFDTEVKMHYNSNLAYSSLCALAAKHEDSILYYEPTYPDRVENHTVAPYPSKEILRDIFIKEGIEGLKGYEILVPAYITEDGDVFGTPDISPTGEVEENHKLIVVQRFSIYDILANTGFGNGLKSNMHNHLIHHMEHVQTIYGISYVAIVTLNSFALVLLIIYGTGNGNKKEEEET